MNSSSLPLTSQVILISLFILFLQISEIIVLHDTANRLSILHPDGYEVFVRRRVHLRKITSLEAERSGTRLSHQAGVKHHLRYVHYVQNLVSSHEVVRIAA